MHIIQYLPINFNCGPRNLVIPTDPAHDNCLFDKAWEEEMVRTRLVNLRTLYSN